MIWKLIILALAVLVTLSFFIAGWLLDRIEALEVQVRSLQAERRSPSPEGA